MVHEVASDIWYIVTCLLYRMQPFTAIFNVSLCSYPRVCDWRYCLELRCVHPFVSQVSCSRERIGIRSRWKAPEHIIRLLGWCFTVFFNCFIWTVRLVLCVVDLFRRYKLWTRVTVVSQMTWHAGHFDERAATWGKPLSLWYHRRHMTWQ